MLRQRLFNIGLFQLFILGMRMTSTVNLGQRIVQSWLNLDNSDNEEDLLHPIPGDDEELTCLWKLLDQTILLSCILCLLYGTRDDNETAKGHKSLLLRFWMLIASMYNIGFSIGTALLIDWINWNLDDVNIDLGQLSFVLANSAIFLFVARYVNQIEIHILMRNGNFSGVSVVPNHQGGQTRRPPKLPKANPPQRARKPIIKV